MHIDEVRRRLRLIEEDPEMPPLVAGVLEQGREADAADITAEETMAYIPYDRAVHATNPVRRLALGRLFALAAAVGLWAVIIAGARAIF